MPTTDVIDDLRVFRFVEAQCRLDHAVAAKNTATTEMVAAEHAMQDAFAELTVEEQTRVNDAYYADRVNRLREAVGS